jgi:Cache domain
VSASAPSRAEGAAGAFTVDARVVLDAFQRVVEEHLTGALYGLRALAATSDVQSGDWDRIKGPLGQFSGDLPNDAVMWFVKPDGSYSTVEKGLTDKNLKDRDYFPVLMAGKDVNDAIVVSKTTGISTVVVATPVVKDGKVVGALGVSISLEKLAKLVDDTLGLPSDVVFYALDQKGQTALHKDTANLMLFPTNLGEDTLKKAVQEMLSKPEGIESYDLKGAHKTAIFKKSPATGWVFVLGITH